MNYNQAIWEMIDVGDQLEAIETLHVPNDNGEQVQTFTSGKRYKIIYFLLPNRSVRVMGDCGIPHMIEGDYIQHFKLIPLQELKYS
jgi:hypothetical protein